MDKLRSKGETGIHGKFYEREIALWSALKCLADKNIKDFWILSNPTGPDKFDDVILHLEYENGQKELFYLQMKHKIGEKREFQTCMLSSKGKYQLSVFQADYSKISDHKAFSERHEIGDDVKSFFFIYSNFLKAEKEYSSDLSLTNAAAEEVYNIVDSSTTGSNNVYKVHDLKSCYNKKFLEQFYMWLNQIDEDAIEQRICTKFKINPFIVKGLMYYFLKRFEAEKKEEKLTRKEMTRRMLEIFFQEYKIPKSTLIDRNVSANILNIIKSFKITVITQSLSEQKLWHNIEEEIDKLDPNWKSRKTEDEAGHQKIRETYLDLVTDFKIPVFIETRNSLFMSFIDYFLHAVCMSVVIFKNTNDPIEFAIDDAEILENINVNNYEKVNLSSDYTIKVSFQGKAPVNMFELLKAIPNEKYVIDMDTFIKHVNTTLKIGKPEEVPAYYINRKVNIPVMKPESSKSRFKGNRSKCTKIFCNCSEEMATSSGFISVSDYIDGGMKSRHKYLYHPFPFQSDLFGTYDIITTQRTKHVHYFELLRDGFYRPILKVGQQKCRLVEIFPLPTEDKDLIRFCNQETVNLICNNAGEGKTMLLKYISQHFPPDYWVIKINLNNFTDLSKLKDLKAFVQEILRLEKQNTNKMFHDLIGMLYTFCWDTRKIVWLIDDYEEIKTPHLMEILRLGQRAGVQIWISSRPSTRSELENHFGISAMELIPIKSQEQTEFYEKYSGHITRSINSPTILNNIHNVRTKMDNTFIGVFQQMTMLAEIFKSSDSCWRKEVKVVDIYQKFVELKVQSLAYHQQKMLTILLKKFAMVLLFSETTTGKLFNTEEVFAQMEYFKGEYSKGAIITDITDDHMPVFSHKTYAEYLAALWLAEQVEKDVNNKDVETEMSSIVKEMIQMLYIDKMSNVRYFFDSILTKSCPVLFACVNRNYQLMETLYQKQTSVVGSKDILGRSILHFLIGNEPHCDTQLNKGIFRHIDEEHASAIESDDSILLTVPKRNYSLLQETKYDMWFVRCASQFRKEGNGNDYLTIRDSYFGISLNEFILLSGALVLLDRLLAERKVNLPVLERTSKHFILAQSIINGFNNILRMININGLNISKTRVKNHSFMSLLHLSMTFNNSLAFQTLFAMERRLEAWPPDINNNTVLHLASELQDEQSIKLLISKGIFSHDQLNIKNRMGFSIFHSLCITGYNQYVTDLVNSNEIDLELECNQGNTPFISCMRCGNFELAKLLWTKGINIEHRNINGDTALHYACLKNFFTGIRQMITWKADVNSQNNLGQTALHLAILNNSQEACDLLLKNRANVNCRNVNGWTPLHYAVKSNNMELLHSLMIKGANIGIKNSRNETPFMMATFMGKLEALRYMIHFENDEGISNAYRFALQKKRKQIITIIELYKKMYYPCP